MKQRARAAAKYPVWERTVLTEYPGAKGGFDIATRKSTACWQTKGGNSDRESIMGLISLFMQDDVRIPGGGGIVALGPGFLGFEGTSRRAPPS